MTKWEYTTLTLKVVLHKERTGGFFAHHNLQSNLDPECSNALADLGLEGWEVVSVVPLPVPKDGLGRDFGVAILKRVLP